MTGETMLKEGISPFPPSAFDGGNGTFPDPSGISDMHSLLSPYFTVSGDLGFLKISEIFSVDSVEISKSHGKKAGVNQSFSLSDKASRNDTISEIRAMITAAKSSSGLASTRVSVRGRFVQNGRLYHYQAHHGLEENGDWELISWQHAADGAALRHRAGSASRTGTRRLR